MHLRSLENYIVQLGVSRINSTTTAFLDADEVLSDLIKILLEEESNIPDFVVNDGRHISDESFMESYDGFFDDYVESDSDRFEEDLSNDVSSMEVSMKRFFWFSITVAVGLIGFLTGFFSAP
jgi:hypothetical protein